MSSNSGHSSTVLTVDDSVVMQEMIKRALGRDYRVIVASNAVDALALIYHEKISVLLLDVSMPGIDGLEFCRTVRNLPQFRDLPIIMLTARDKLFDKVQGRLAGATEYLTKPFDAHQLQQVVEKFVNENLAAELPGEA
ncbi:response regulator [Aerosakkonemataceae cyanobacterium BLCC-F154]|uniref:Response regulator n=1 Tax=Floridaenema fluviatile BLCC-F154 TaxID=3153640 RepID=A0ABV4YFV8_9CYAN